MIRFLDDSEIVYAPTFSAKSDDQCSVSSRLPHVPVSFCRLVESQYRSNPRFVDNTLRKLIRDFSNSVTMPPLKMIEQGSECLYRLPCLFAL